MKPGRTVYHRLDPTKTPLQVIEVFNWLGGKKVQTQTPDGEYIKDWDYEFDEGQSHAPKNKKSRRRQ